MTPQQIAKDIERGLQIREEIDTLKAELKKVESRIKEAAQETTHVPLEDETREGRQALLRSAKRVLPVRFTSDAIVASFDADSEIHQQIAEITGDKLPLFFAPSTRLSRVPKDGLAFREVARQHLEARTFAELIHAATARNKDGIAKSSTVIAWDDIKSADAVPT